MLFPTTCVVCGRPGAAVCRDCADALRPAPALPRPVGVDGCAAVVSYDGAGRELLARLKYRNGRAAVGLLGRAMASLVAPAEVDVVTWAPTTPRRRRRRGYDQAELLARVVARDLGLPCRRLLRRRPGPHQTGRPARERRTGLAFDCLRPCAGLRVLVVDDVVTTGATVGAAAAALRRAGAGAVRVLAGARTPPGRG